MLLLGQQIMESSLRATVGHIRDAKLLSSSQLSEMDRIIAVLLRLRDSVMAELVIASMVYAGIAVRLHSHLPLAQPWMFSGAAGNIALSLARWYHGSDQPVYVSVPSRH